MKKSKEKPLIDEYFKLHHFMDIHSFSDATQDAMRLVYDDIYSNDNKILIVIYIAAFLIVLTVIGIVFGAFPAGIAAGVSLPFIAWLGGLMESKHKRVIKLARLYLKQIGLLDHYGMPTKQPPRRKRTPELESYSSIVHRASSNA